MTYESAAADVLNSLLPGYRRARRWLKRPETWRIGVIWLSTYEELIFELQEAIGEEKPKNNRTGSLVSHDLS